MGREGVPGKGNSISKGVAGGVPMAWVGDTDRVHVLIEVTLLPSPNPSPSHA